MMQSPQVLFKGSNQPQLVRGFAHTTRPRSVPLSENARCVLGRRHPSIVPPQLGRRPLFRGMRCHLSVCGRGRIPGLFVVRLNAIRELKELNEDLENEGGVELRWFFLNPVQVIVSQVVSETIGEGKCPESTVP